MSDPFAVPQQPPTGGQQPPGEPPASGSYGYGQPGYGDTPPGYGPPPGPPPYAPPGYGPPPYGWVAPVAQRTNGLAIASLVLGILWLYWIGSVLALVFGYTAKRQIRERGESGEGLATAGIVLGWIGVGFLSLFFLLGLLGFAGSL